MKQILDELRFFLLDLSFKMIYKLAPKDSDEKKILAEAFTYYYGALCGEIKRVEK